MGSAVLLVSGIVAGWALFVAFAWTRVVWSTHAEMTRTNSDGWGYGTRAQFWQQFHRHKWERGRDWPKSWFDYSTDSEIHASIIRFDGKGMVLRPWDYWRVTRALKRMRSDGAPVVWSIAEGARVEVKRG